MTHLVLTVLHRCGCDFFWHHSRRAFRLAELRLVLQIVMLLLYNEMENKLQSRKTIGATGIKRGKHRMARVQRAMSETSLTGHADPK